MRPQFDIPVAGDGQAVITRLREQLEAPDAGFQGQVRGNHAFVRMLEGSRTLLSPHLNLELRETEEGPVIHGRFSPQPNVWMGFVALFFVLGIAGISGVVWGAAQYMLGGPIWTMWSAPVSVALIAFIYGAAFIGQGLSNEEMFELRAFVECTVREVCGDDQGRGV